MERPIITIRGKVTDLRLTVASLKRIKQAMGMSMAEFGKALEDSEIGPEDTGTLVWAMIAHNDELAGLTEDQVAGSLDWRALPKVAEAIRGVLNEEQDPEDPPRAEPGAAAGPPGS